MLIRGLFALLCCLLPFTAYAFPANGVLDTFTGADNTSPPDANWTNNCTGGATVGLDLEDNAVTTHTTANAGCAYWNPTLFNASQEAYSTIVDATANYFCVLTRLINIGANTTNGYEICAADASAGAVANTVNIWRFDNGAATKLGANISQTVSVGDQIGGTAIGDQICAYYKVGAGAWTQLGCRTDATYNSAGRIGIEVAGDTTIGNMDDFGGGNVLMGGGMMMRPPVNF